MKSLNNFKYLANALIRPAIEKKLVYIHLPKCGGTSLKNAITSYYGIRSYISQGHVFHLDATASVKAATLLDMDVYEYRKKLLHYTLLSKAKFISGHFPFGEDIWDNYGVEWSFITILRDPVRKWISNYYYNRYNKDPKHVWKITESIEEFIHTDKALTYGNDYVNQIIGRPLDTIDTNYFDISKAINLLEKFSVVGILENMDKFGRDFKSNFGVQLKILHENMSPVNISKHHEITSDVRKSIKKLCEPNLAIYNHFNV